MLLPRPNAVKAIYLGASLAAAALVMASGSAQAKHNGLDDHSAKQKVSSVLAKKEPQVAASTAQDTALPPNCQRGRKKLWVEEQGWVVRKVTTCF